MDQRFVLQAFPRSSAYHPEWVLAGVSGGANPLWLTEWLAEALDLRPGMRVLDLGCGRGDVVDLPAPRVRRAGLGHRPVVQRLGEPPADPGRRRRGRRLPDPRRRAVAAVRRGVLRRHRVDRLLLLLRHGRPVPELPRPVREAGRPGGDRRGRADAGDRRTGPRATFASGGPRICWCLHSAAWWRRHWERTGILDIEVADTLPDGWRFWLDWHRAVAPDNVAEIQALEADRGRTSATSASWAAGGQTSGCRSRSCRCHPSIRRRRCSGAQRSRPAAVGARSM